MTRNIPPALSFVPNVVHRSIFTLCIDAPVGRNGEPYCPPAPSQNGARPYFHASRVSTHQERRTVYGST
jgi:hypothetical protein